ncbi:hypothetical protein ACNQR7_07550 [Mycolicibacterium senegalense]|uniref:hypothetical protein n=1 Tax=Mycolicibacterium senegalense TaxID=1796 RepID=UPI003AAD99EE
MTIDMTGLPPREQRLYTHTVASAVAQTSSNQFVQFQVSGREPSPAAQEVRVLAELDAALTGLDALIRSKKTAPVGVPVATLGRRLAERDEQLDAVNGTYEPGPGLKTLILGVAHDALHALEEGGR